MPAQLLAAAPRFLIYSFTCCRSLAAGAMETIAALDHPGRPSLACSYSGRSISAVWPELRAYAVYTLAPTGSWEVVDRGEWRLTLFVSLLSLHNKGIA